MTAFFRISPTKKSNAGTCDNVSRLDKPETKTTGMVQKKIKKNIFYDVIKKKLNVKGGNNNNERRRRQQQQRKQQPKRQTTDL